VSLEDLCAEWLNKNFDIDAKIGHVIVLRQKEIDKALNLVAVKFYFTDVHGVEGDAIAFLNTIEVPRKEVETVALQGCRTGLLEDV